MVGDRGRRLFRGEAVFTITFFDDKSFVAAELELQFGELSRRRGFAQQAAARAQLGRERPCFRGVGQVLNGSGVADVEAIQYGVKGVATPGLIQMPYPIVVACYIFFLMRGKGDGFDDFCSGDVDWCCLRGDAKCSKDAKQGQSQKSDYPATVLAAQSCIRVLR